MANTILHCYGTPGKGIPNAYFCGGDSQYFHMLYEEICKLGKISLWYDAKMRDADEISRKFELEQMDLFIVPVTNALLENLPEDYASDYLVALTNSIPVLPIAFEQINDDLYSAVFGKRHYLLFDVAAGVTLSFLGKLENYLSALLVSSELVDRIKSAFAGYVFLSYRKKDRIHIPAIMRAVHSNDDLIDIAVWYDEFLTPGENFDDHIEQKMKESDAFLLSVTPNLLEEGNYVMTKEYPFALEEKIPILPIEVELTEKSGLDKLYPNIPYCQPIDSVKAITDALIEKLPRRNRIINHERDYLIGMAYLFGIDVEVDRERGFQLIERAADAGFEEAVHVLSDQELQGVGIESKISRARQQRRVDICRKRYEQEGTVESICAYADALEEQAKIEDAFCYYDYHSQADLKKRPVPNASILMVELLERECERIFDEKLIDRLIDAYFASAAFYSGRQRTAEENMSNLKSIAWLKRIAERNPSPEVFERIAELYHSFYADGLNSPSNVIHYHVEALQYYYQAYGDDRSIEHLKTYFDLSNGIGREAFYCLSDEDHEIGREHRILALDLMEEILEKQPTIENARILYECYVHYCEETGDHMDRLYVFDAKTRILYCHFAQKIYYEFHFEELDDEETDGILVLSNLLMAVAFLELRDYENALELYQCVVDLYDPTIRCVLDPHEADSLCNALKKSYLGGFQCLENLGRLQEAYSCAEYLLDTFRLERSDYEVLIDLWISNRDSNALEMFMYEHLDIYCQLVWDKAEANRFWKERILQDLFDRCNKAYEICQEAQLDVIAAAYLSMAAVSLKKSMGNNRKKICDLVKMCMQIGDIYRQCGADSDVYDWYSQGLRYAVSLDHQQASMDEVHLLVLTNIRMGEYYECNEQSDLAEDYYVYAIRYALRIYAATKDRTDLLEAIRKITELFAMQGNRFYVLKKCISLIKKLRGK